jgi:phospholipid/cholesterol/gamma-HCH transport system substrate-binding protein
MENRAYALLTGLFTVLLIAATVGAFMWFRGDTARFEPYLVVSNISVSGLSPQASVRFRGVDVGKVETIRLDSRDPRNILIRISVDRELPLTRGTFAQLGYQGVTGLAYVALDDDGTDPTRIRPGDDTVRIEVRGNVFDDLATQSRQLLDQASNLLNKLDEIVSDENKARIGNTLANFEAASKELMPVLRTIPEVTERAHQFLGPENVESFRRSLASLEQATGSIAPIAEDSRQVLASMRSLSDRLDQVASEVSGEVTEHTLPRVNTLIDQLAQDSRELRRLLLNLEREPQSMIFGRTPPAPGPGEPGFKDGRR